MRRLSSVMMVNPVVVVSKQKQTKGTNKQNLATKATKKATEKWLFMVWVRLPTPTVGGVPRYRWGYS